MKKIVVLNSGGFDSTVLLHYVRDNFPEAEIHSLHFSYGQRAYESELHWSNYHAKHVGAKSKVINLPVFDWTSKGFYTIQDDGNLSDCYLEWRNLVFISYAFSYAESIGASSIFAAFVNESVEYKDASEHFIHVLNLLDKDIRFYAPFARVEKEELINLAFQFGIEPDTFFSCKTPDTKTGEPCNVCGTCQFIHEANEELKIDSTYKVCRKSYDLSSEEFSDLMLQMKPQQLRVFWNDKCQLQCKHCYCGESTNIAPLTLDEFLSVTEQALQYGITDISLSGKEPLYDDSVLQYLAGVKKLGERYPINDFSIVTNGLRFPLVAKELKTLGVNRIFISVDDFPRGTGLVRETSNEKSLEAIRAAQSLGFDLGVFVVIHQGNYNNIHEILYSLERVNVTDVTLTLLENIGYAKYLPEFSTEQLIQIWEQLVSFKSENDEFTVTFSTDIPNTQKLCWGYSKMNGIISRMNYNDDFRISDSVYWSPEYICTAYSNYVVLTHDGYILGCNAMRSVKNYASISAGNIHNYSFAELMSRGKHKFAREIRNCFLCQGCNFD